MLALHGTGVGAGIAIGRVRILRRPGHGVGHGVEQYAVAADEVEQEVGRLARAIGTARESLLKLSEEHHGELEPEVSALLDAHVTMLEDPSLLAESAVLIREQLVNAEFALTQHGRRLEAAFSRINDPYLRSKSADVAQVMQRILGAMTDADSWLSQHPEGTFDGEIVITTDLSPADTIELKKHRINGFITSLGGPVSHTAILARSMKIPAIVGLHGAVRFLRSGDLLILDGKRGVVLADPDEKSLAAYQRRREKIIRRNQALDSLLNASSESLDGQHVGLFSNVELPDEVDISVRQKAEGIGLYRTEFLFMNRESLPDEEEQFEVYKQIVQRSTGQVTIRTLDLGADKQVDGGRASNSGAINPALGLRAIRLCLHDLALFKPQLRAIYRASAFGRARMMVPMLTRVDELNQLFGLIAEVKQELTEQGIDFDHSMPVGAMIEVPAAAIAADIFACKLDFLSIGTNDLIQYTLAIDRIDDEVNYLYDPLHPAILRLIQMVTTAGRNAGIPVSMCGEMAGNPEYTRILLALGLREFSMDPSSILEVKQRIRMSDVSLLESALPSIMQAIEPEDLRQKMVLLNQ